MFTLKRKLKKLLKTLEVNKTSRDASQREFLFSKFLRNSSKQQIALSRSIREEIRSLEPHPVLFSYLGEKVTQSVDFESLIFYGKKVLENLEGSSFAEREERALLERELVALQYRLEGVNGGLDPVNASLEHLNALAEAVKSWKFSYVVFHDKALSSYDIYKLQEVCQYPAFMDLLLKDEALQESFFLWAFRDKLPVNVFIQFPSIQEKINQADLNGRLARIGRESLKVKKVSAKESFTGAEEKIVTLPVEGQDVNILNPEAFVILKGNYVLSIREMFEQFENKKFGATNLEFMVEGIVNWNAYNWGCWNAETKEYELVDLDQSEWWTKLPAFEVLSLKEARKYFGEHLDGTQWNIAMVSTRSTETLDFQGTHAYTSIAIPTQEGKYAVYPFGKYAREFPSTPFKILANIGKTVNATVCYPDENVYYTHRQHSRYSFAATPEQVKRFLKEVHYDMKLAQAGNFVYQIESENCAKWAFQKLEQVFGVHRLPNVFQMDFLDQQPHGFLGTIFNALSKLPEAWQVPVVSFLHILLGGVKGEWIWEEGRRVWKSLIHHAFARDNVIYQPAMLHHQQAQGVIGHFVPQGVTFTRELIAQTYHKLQGRMVLFAEYIESKLQEYRGAIKGAVKQFTASFERWIENETAFFSLNLLNLEESHG